MLIVLLVFNTVPPWVNVIPETVSIPFAPKKNNTFESDGDGVKSWAGVKLDE